MGGRERTEQKKEELEERKKDPKNQAMYVCDLQALKVGTPVRTRVRVRNLMRAPARRGDVPGLAQEASLKCQTTISTPKPNCTAQIQAYRVGSARFLTFPLTCSGVFHRILPSLNFTFPSSPRCPRAGLSQGHRGGAEEGARQDILGDLGQMR